MAKQPKFVNHDKERREQDKILSHNWNPSTIKPNSRGRESFDAANDELKRNPHAVEES